MRLDNIPKPCTFYYEDTEGNNIPFDMKKDMFPPSGKWHAQHSKYVQVQESICFGSSGKANKDKWPVKFINYILYKLPASWKKVHPCMTFNSTINCCWPIVKHLVENRKWSFNEACVASADLCERCLNRVLDDIGGIQVAMNQHYYDTVNTSCKNCVYIDPDHYERRKVKAAYKAFKHGANIKECFEEGNCIVKHFELKEEKTHWYNRLANKFFKKK